MVSTIGRPLYNCATSVCWLSCIAARTLMRPAFDAQQQSSPPRGVVDWICSGILRAARGSDN